MAWDPEQLRGGGAADPDISLREFKPTELLREDFAFYSLSKYGS